MEITLLKRVFCRVFSKIKGKCICTSTLSALVRQKWANLKCTLLVMKAGRGTKGLLHQRRVLIGHVHQHQNHQGTPLKSTLHWSNKYIEHHTRKHWKIQNSYQNTSLKANGLRRMGNVPFEKHQKLAHHFLKQLVPVQLSLALLQLPAVRPPMLSIATV